MEGRECVHSVMALGNYMDTSIGCYAPITCRVYGWMLATVPVYLRL